MEAIAIALINALSNNPVILGCLTILVGIGVFALLFFRSIPKLGEALASRVAAVAKTEDSEEFKTVANTVASIREDQILSNQARVQQGADIKGLKDSIEGIDKRVAKLEKAACANADTCPNKPV
jgi:hypothetical protein